MTSLILFLVFCQALGAVIGVCSVIWGELVYVRAMRDGKVDRAERVHLDHVARGLRFGMTLLLAASLSLVILSYHLRATEQPALTTSYWILIVLALLVIFASWGLSRGRISFKLGSAISFTGWWFLAYLTFGQIPEISFGATVAFFVVATVIFYALLQYVRFLLVQKNSKNVLE